MDKKKCNRCKELKLFEEFGRQDRGKFDLNGRCKKCINEIGILKYKERPEAIKANQKRYHLKNPNARANARANARLKYIFNITLEDYNLMLKYQDFLCAICKTPSDKFRRLFDVDHCHSTGKIRGLLCLNCNKGVGLFKDNVATLENAINYLK